jgi:hypothetical protein
VWTVATASDERLDLADQTSPTLAHISHQGRDGGSRLLPTPHSCVLAHHRAGLWIHRGFYPKGHRGLKERNNSAYCRLKKISCGFKEQARDRHPGEKYGLDSIEVNLAELGSDKTRIVSAQVYISNIDDKPVMDKVWKEWIGSNPDNWPQRACLGVDLGGNWLLARISHHPSRQLLRSVGPPKPRIGTPHRAALLYSEASDRYAASRHTSMCVSLGTVVRNAG